MANAIKRADTRLLVRMRFIEAMLEVQGFVRPRDVREMFGVEVATSGRDIAAYSKLRPENIMYHPQGKIWLAPPWFKVTPEWWVKQGFFDGREDSLSFLTMLKRVQGSNMTFVNNLGRSEHFTWVDPQFHYSK